MTSRSIRNMTLAGVGKLVLPLFAAGGGDVGVMVGVLDEALRLTGSEHPASKTRQKTMRVRIK